MVTLCIVCLNWFVPPSDLKESYMTSFFGDHLLFTTFNWISPRGKLAYFHKEIFRIRKHTRARVHAHRTRKLKG